MESPCKREKGRKMTKSELRDLAYKLVEIGYWTMSQAMNWLIKNRIKLF